jgi:hypothetical protein
MKTNNRKILQLINHGFSGSLLSDLNEGQINSLYKRLVESITTKDPKKALELNKMDPNANVQLTTETEVSEDSDSGDLDLALALQSKEVTEKFESKKQQKYFFAKCGDGETKEQKKWCKMAEEFAEKTNFKKIPKKKKETKEGYMDMIGKAMNKNMGNKIADIRPSVNMGESELEKKIMRLVEKHITPKMSKKDFLSLVSEQGTKEKERTKEKEKTKEKERGTPYSPKPGPAKAPKALKHEVDEQEVAPSKPKTKEPITKPTKPGTPYSPKPGPAKAPKASKGKLPSWLSFKSIGIKLK